MVLNVKVGACGLGSVILPYGTRPNLINAWNPLQIPNIKPSRCSKRLLTASLIFGLRKVVAINLPEPSGSSPPEKPPGSITICASLILRTISSIVSSISFGVKFFTTKISAIAPARSKARAVSTSQLVPGNAGINTLGFALLIAGAF